MVHFCRSNATPSHGTPFVSRRRLLLAAASLPLSLGQFGCGPTRPEEGSLFVGIDTSGSARARLADYAEIASRLLRAGRRHVAGARLSRVDHETLEFYAGPPSLSLKRLNTLLVRELKPPARRSRTRPEAFWDSVRERMPSGGSVYVALITDGGMDDLSAPARSKLTRAVQALAEESRVARVAVWGVFAVHRERLQRDLSPFGDRLRIAGYDDIDLKEFFIAPAPGASRE